MHAFTHVFTGYVLDTDAVAFTENANRIVSYARLLYCNDSE